MLWLDEPPPGTPVTIGADFSDSDDWSALRGRTKNCFGFTPRHGDGEPTIWRPGEIGERVPRDQVHAAIDLIFEKFDVRRFYFDPFGWATEGERWQSMYGDYRVIPWPTNKVVRMHAALVRARTDMSNGVLTHDGCPLTALAMSNARMVPHGQHYVLGKPSQRQKIDPAMADVLAHEAWADVTVAAEWRAEAEIEHIGGGIR